MINRRRARYKMGCVRLDKSNAWRFVYSIGGGKQKSVRLGTLNELPTKAKALRAAEPVRKEVNECTRQIEFQSSSGTVNILIERYRLEKMPKRSTTSYASYLNNHILPRWGSRAVTEIRPAEIESWLLKLPLANKTRGNIRGIMHRLFDCAMLWDYLPVGRNPMDVIRIDGITKRTKEPRILTPEEFHAVISHIPEPYKTMVLTDVCLGLRVSELIGLKWSDFDWQKSTVLVQRAVVGLNVDTVKTKYSKQRLPLDPKLAEHLRVWKSQSEFSAESDWVWASPARAGEFPMWPGNIRQRYLIPAGKKAEVGAIGWHTFRHTYRAWLDESGSPMSVQQELMRHASISTTMNVYGGALKDSLRQANSRVVSLVM